MKKNQEEMQRLAKNIKEFVPISSNTVGGKNPAPLRFVPPSTVSSDIEDIPLPPLAILRQSKTKMMNVQQIIWAFWFDVKRFVATHVAHLRDRHLTRLCPWWIVQPIACLDFFCLTCSKWFQMFVVESCPCLREVSLSLQKLVETSSIAAYP